MIKQKIITFTLFALLASSVLGVLQVTQVSAGAPNQTNRSHRDCDENRFLTLPPWYRGLTTGRDCNIDVNAMPGSSQDAKLRTFIQILALNIVEIMMHIVSYVCVAFIIVGGFKYMTSTGSPDGNTKGRQTIQNAIIGLIISIVSIGIINFIARGAI